MTEPNLEPDGWNDPPYAKITQVGRFTYEITIVRHRWLGHSGWYALGRRRAEAKARRLIARQQLEEQREREAWRVS